MYSVRYTYTIKPEHNDFNNTPLASKKVNLAQFFSIHHLVWKGRENRLNEIK